ncbi:aminotransferase class IV family protein [Phytomonospora sp. NPDC050363]|uniref:aminotransferase class IV family protein n=1 Tax=Phytomonospora sp. NPDC050363 TaxID=3155642 RepID=UPI0033CB560A
MSFYVVQRNGGTATAEDLAPLAFTGYAHFTAAQVRGGLIKGLDLHLERLQIASLAMFGRALPDDLVRSRLRTALAAGPSDVSLLATVYSSTGEFTADDGAAELDLLVRTGAPSSGPAGPLSLATVEHERFLPAVKHVGEVAKTYVMRQAVRQGFDDAAFLDRRGRLSEASIWNLAFWDGEAVVWPSAEMLGGTMMGTVRRQLERLGAPQRVQEVRPADLPGLSGAVVMNSWTPGIAVDRIGEAALPAAPSFVELLHAAHEAEPPVAP